MRSSLIQGRAEVENVSAVCLYFRNPDTPLSKDLSGAALNSSRHQQGTPQSRKGPSHQQTHHEEPFCTTETPRKQGQKVNKLAKNLNCCQGQAYNPCCSCQPQGHRGDWHCHTTQGDIRSQASNSLLRQRHSWSDASGKQQLPAEITVLIVTIQKGDKLME